MHRRAFDTNYLDKEPGVGVFPDGQRDLGLQRASSSPDLAYNANNVPIHYPAMNPEDQSLPVYVEHSNFYRAGGVLPQKYFTILGTLNTSVTPSTIRSIIYGETLIFDFVHSRFMSQKNSETCPPEMPNTGRVVDTNELSNPYRDSRLPVTYDSRLYPLLASSNEYPYKTVFMVVNIGWKIQSLGHANALVLIWKAGTNVVTVERFEPHGDDLQFYPKNNEKDIGASQTLFDDLLRKAFSSNESSIRMTDIRGKQVNVDTFAIYKIRRHFGHAISRATNPEYQYIGLQTDSCPLALVGPQSKQHYFHGELGLCSIWSAFYLDLRIRNPERTSHEIVTSLLEMSSVQLLQMVQKFALYMELVVKKLSSRTCRTLELFSLYSRVRHIVNTSEPISDKLIKDLSSATTSMESLGLILQCLSVALTPDFDEYRSQIVEAQTVQELLMIAKDVPESVRPPLCAEGFEKVAHYISLGTRVLGVFGLDNTPDTTCEPQCNDREVRHPFSGQCMELGQFVRGMQAVTNS